MPNPTRRRTVQWRTFFCNRSAGVSSGDYEGSDGLRVIPKVARRQQLVVILLTGWDSQAERPGEPYARCRRRLRHIQGMISREGDLKSGGRGHARYRRRTS